MLISKRRLMPCTDFSRENGPQKVSVPWDGPMYGGLGFDLVQKFIVFNVIARRAIDCRFFCYLFCQNSVLVCGISHMCSAVYAFTWAYFLWNDKSHQIETYIFGISVKESIYQKIEFIFEGKNKGVNCL